jgi:ABC-type transport system substrate-binding protein
VVRRPIADARKLLSEAGYPGGRDAVTGRPLVLSYDYYNQPTPEVKSQLDWMVKQFAKIDVQLEIRATDNNQFQDKVRKGKHQIFWSGWLADYPDAENFLFLLYGPNAKSTSDGENTANYANPEYDALFAQLKGVDDGPEKQALIDRMTTIVQQDAPWSFGYFPYSSGAFQAWVHNAKPAVLVRDMTRYIRIDAAERVRRQAEWNRPVWWPMGLGAVGLIAIVWLALRSFRRREQLDARGVVLS